MNENEKRRKIWFSIPVRELIPMLGMQGLTPEFVPDVCRYNPQRITDAMFQCANKSINDIGADMVVIAATMPMMRTDDSLECVVVLGGNPEELEKVVSHGLPFERMMSASERNDWEQLEKMKRELEDDASTQYGKMKQSAFNLMRKKNIRSFSDAELHRVFKHAKEHTTYLSIVKTAIEDGLTISGLYEQGRENGLER